MITNFDYLKNDPKFSVSQVLLYQQKRLSHGSGGEYSQQPQGNEFAIKWMYSVDSELEMPYQDNLQSLMNAEEYRQIVGPDLGNVWIIFAESGNNAAHAIKNWEEMKQCFVWKICLFI